MPNDTRASSSMAGVVSIGALVVALFSIDWTQLGIDLFWFLVGWVMGSCQRLVDAIAWVFSFMFQ